MVELVLKLVWDPENECDLAAGFTRGDDEVSLNAFKVGSVVLIWGRDRA